MSDINVAKREADVKVVSDLGQLKDEFHQMKVVSHLREFKDKYYQTDMPSANA